MARMRRARKHVRVRRAPDLEASRASLSAPAFDMEEPLREARHLIHVIGAISQYRGEDNEAISTVAGEASRKLDIVEKHLRRIFAAARRADR